MEEKQLFRTGSLNDIIWLKIERIFTLESLIKTIKSPISKIIDTLLTALLGWVLPGSYTNVQNQIRRPADVVQYILAQSAFRTIACFC